MNRGAWWATWGHKKLDATEQLTLSLSKICQGARCVLSTRGIHMHSMMGMAVTENAPHNVECAVAVSQRKKNDDRETQGCGIVSVGVEYHSNSSETKYLFSLDIPEVYS